MERDALSHFCDYLLRGFNGKMKPEESETPKAPEPTRTLDDEVKLRLDILEEGIKKVIAKMDNVPMFNRFICLNNLQNGLIVLSNGREPGQTDIQRVARLEMGIGEALNFLQTSKLAKRFNLLKEIKKDLEEVIDRSSQV